MPFIKFKLANNISINLAQHTNIREFETVDMPAYIRSKSVTFYKGIYFYDNILILTHIYLIFQYFFE